MPFVYPYLTVEEAEHFIRAQGLPSNVLNAQGGIPESRLQALIETHAGAALAKLRAVGYVYPLQPLTEGLTEVDPPTQSVIKLMIGNMVATQFAQRQTAGDRSVKGSGATGVLTQLFDDIFRGRVYLDLKYQEGSLAQRMIAYSEAPKWSVQYEINPRNIWDYAALTGGLEGLI